ncbi:HAD family hydrolase [Ammoniphilus sp. YIM 78166]|uniref:HAD family hydrolase n=1 Tax=Ammoniphilus sp. YIM 78166 TaxID=1644106 RepID=UPI00106FA0C4|nr:HAD family hydrolase [Ammoniphilus sp. YIM 78166]
MYKVVFLDLDNTLFSFDNMYEKVSQQALQHVIGLNQLGISFDVFYDQFRSIADQLYFEVEKGQRSMDSYRDERWIRTFKSFQIPVDHDMMNQLNKFIISNYLEFVEPYEGAKEFLGLLQERYRVGLITNGAVDMQRAKLERMNMLPFFEEKLIVISEEVGVSKPDPGIFHSALTSAGISPTEAVHFGDSIHHDIKGANLVGMSSALIHTEVSDQQLPTYRFQDFFDATKGFLNER